MDDSTGEQKGHTEHAAQHQREEQHEIEAALENVGPEDGRGDKADDGARPVRTAWKATRWLPWVP